MMAASDIGNTAGLVFWGSPATAAKTPAAPKQAGDRGFEIDAIGGCASYHVCCDGFL
jgi:hypothetical protein